MALSYVGGTSGNGTGSTYAVSLTALTGGSNSAPAAGDLVIVVTGWASTSNGDPGVTTAGYNEIVDDAANDTRDANLSVSWKIMGGTPDTSVTVRGFNNAANGGATVIHVWRGADQTTPIDVASTTGGSNNSSNPNSPSITPVTVGAVVLTCGIGTGDTTPQAKTAPSGYGNTRSQTGAGSTMSAIACIASKAWSGSGAEDPGVWSGGETSNSDSWFAASIAIRPFISTGPTMESGVANDAGRNYDNRTQNISVVFSEAVEIIPAPNVGDTIGGLELLLEFTWLVPCTYVSGNGTTNWVVNVNPFPDPAFEIVNNSFLGLDYDAPSGAIVSVANGTELPDNDFVDITNNLTKRLRLELKDKTGAALNAVTVQYVVFRHDNGVPANANWMAQEQKGTVVTDANGKIDIEFTGTSIASQTAYVAILQPDADPTESLLWTTEIR